MNPPLERGLGAALPGGWVLRARTDDDLAFLSDLYAQTREDEMRNVDWPESQKRAFLHDQFNKQHAHYSVHYPGASWWVLEQGSVLAGRLYVSASATELRLMDLSLVAGSRGQGVGTAIMSALATWADRAAVPVTLHVEPFNPALRLYRRLGFEHVETRGIYEFMRRPVAPVN